MFDRVCRKERGVTEDAQKVSPAAFKGRQNEAKSSKYGDTCEDGYMDIDALDMPKDKPQDIELDNVSMDGPYSMVKDPAVNGQAQKETKPAEIVRVEDGGYEQVGDDSTHDVVMVKNDDYKEFGEGNGVIDGIVMVDFAGYAGFTPDSNGNGNGIVMVENADYE